MRESGKTQRVSHATPAEKRSHKRRDASALKNIPQVRCAYPKCGKPFTPGRKDQIYHSAACRKADWFDQHFVSRGARAAKIQCPVHLGQECDCAVAYRLASAIEQLPSYGLIANDRDNPMISRKDVMKLLFPDANQPDIGEDFC